MNAPRTGEAACRPLFEHEWRPHIECRPQRRAAPHRVVAPATGGLTSTSTGGPTRWWHVLEITLSRAPFFHETAVPCQRKSDVSTSTHASIRILMSQLVRGSMQVEFRVKVRRCHLSHELEAPRMERSRRQSTGFLFIGSFENLRFPLHFLPVPNPHTILGKGLKFSPVTHILCSTTASFRATPTMARSVAFLPPSDFARPHFLSAESLPK